jgi:hypothetical protein
MSGTGRSSKTCRVRLGERDTLTVTMHSGYIHLKLTSPGRQFFTSNIYIPRKTLIPLLRWILKSTRVVPANSGDTKFYVPDAERRAYKFEQEIDAQMKAAKKKRDRKRRARI